jgi:hypothetical protein
MLSDALVHRGDKSGGVYKTVAPFLIRASAGLGRESLRQRSALLFECRYFATQFSHHIAEENQVGSCTHDTVSGNNNHLVRYRRDIRFSGADGAVNAAPGRVIDEGVIAIPESVASMKNIRFRKVHGDVRICMCG